MIILYQLLRGKLTICNFAISWFRLLEIWIRLIVLLSFYFSYNGSNDPVQIRLWSRYFFFQKISVSIFVVHNHKLVRGKLTICNFAIFWFGLGKNTATFSCTNWIINCRGLCSGVTRVHRLNSWRTWKGMLWKWKHEDSSQNLPPSSGNC